MNQVSETTPSYIRIAYIKAQWHSDILEVGFQSFVERVRELTQGKATVELFEVPGALEIPLLAKSLAASTRYAAIVGSAFIVDGGIYRHEYVANSVLMGIMQAQLETNIPILSAVLTPHNYQDTDEHNHFFLGHFQVKGREIANACVSILDTHDAIRKVA